mmetsp:Transcript_1962/g.4468  ORF Transcript_1962/g.4468 Transcript_1962/m.4468 type:complete len:266 (+) Transcript_1962:338-1135(+)
MRPDMNTVPRHSPRAWLLFTAILASPPAALARLRWLPWGGQILAGEERIPRLDVRHALGLFHHLRLHLVGEAAPDHLIALAIDGPDGQAGQHLCQHFEKGQDQDVNKPDLTLGDVGGLPVHKHRHRQPQLFLSVSLSKKFCNDPGGPEQVRMKILRRVGDVRRVDNHVQQEQAVALKGSFASLQKIAGGQSRFQLTQLSEVLGDVRRQNRRNHHLPYGPVAPVHGSSEKIAVRELVKQRKSGRHVVHLQHSFVIVFDGKFVPRVH